VSVNTYRSFWRYCKKIAGATKANVVVRISRRVIQFRCERPGVTRVIPIATADEGVLRF
jgi:hypothetical protein